MHLQWLLGIIVGKASFVGIMYIKQFGHQNIGEILHCEQETGNTEDSYAVSVVKGDTIVGHVPCEKSHVVWHFIEHNGIVNCQVTAQRKHGKGLEVPCIYCFTGKEKNINKLQKLLAPAEHKP